MSSSFSGEREVSEDVGYVLRCFYHDDKKYYVLSVIRSITFVEIIDDER